MERARSKMVERDPRKRQLVEQTRERAMDLILSHFFPRDFHAMIIDDDPICASYVTKLLLQCKFKVTHCHPSDAMHFLRDKKDMYHILIIKVHMSDIDAFALLEQTRHVCYLPALMLTLIPTDAVSNRCSDYPDCQHLVFPLDVPKLVQCCYAGYRNVKDSTQPLLRGPMPSMQLRRNIPPLDHFIVRGTETEEDIRRHRKKHSEFSPEVKATVSKTLDELESHLAVAKKAIGLLSTKGEASGTQKDSKPRGTGKN